MPPENDNEQFDRRTSDRSWSEYRRLILAELERLNTLISDTGRKIEETRSTDIAQLRIEIAMLKVKSGMWGALGGLVTGLTALIMIVLRGHL